MPFSKKDFLLGLRCPKSLFLNAYHKELAEVDHNAELVMKGGRDFELVARELIAPGGLLITAYEKKQEDYIEKTVIELEGKNRTLYQATFKTLSGEVVMTDILIKKGDEIEVTEIKGMCEISDVEIYDCAYQYYVLNLCGIKISKFHLAHINKDYLREGEISSEFVIVKDITKPLKRLQSRVAKNVERFKKVLQRQETPEAELGHECFSPSKCPFWGHCTDHLGPQNIFQIKSMRLEKKLNLYRRDIFSISQLAEGNHKLSEGQMIQVMSTLENKVMIQLDALKEWLQPVVEAENNVFMDFETMAPGIPLFNLSKPFESICFLFSLHFFNRKTQKLVHTDFIAEPSMNIDPREKFIKTLITQLRMFDSTAPIIVYSSFEKTRLRELAKIFPKYENEIRAIIARMHDLMQVFQQKLYYHPLQQGSFSIKKVSEVLCPNISSYKEMAINNGGQAAHEYLSLLSASEEDEFHRICSTLSALREYCEKDTEVMKLVVDELVKIVSKENVGLKYEYYEKRV